MPAEHYGFKLQWGSRTSNGSEPILSLVCAVRISYLLIDNLTTTFVLHQALCKTQRHACVVCPIAFPEFKIGVRLHFGGVGERPAWMEFDRTA